MSSISSGQPLKRSRTDTTDAESNTINSGKSIFKCMHVHPYSVIKGFCCVFQWPFKSRSIELITIHTVNCFSLKSYYFVIPIACISCFVWLFVWRLCPADTLCSLQFFFLLIHTIKWIKATTTKMKTFMLYATVTQVIQCLTDGVSRTCLPVWYVKLCVNCKLHDIKSHIPLDIECFLLWYASKHRFSTYRGTLCFA